MFYKGYTLGNHDPVQPSQFFSFPLILQMGRMKLNEKKPAEAQWG